MKISLLVPCYNEALTVEACIKSCLAQSRPFDQLVFVNDSSTDGTAAVLRKYRQKITVHKTPHNTGNKSHAQEYGLRFVTGDVVVTTDADTLLDKDFVKYIEAGFANPNTVAVCGYVSSLPYNWLTLCRAYEYIIGQNIHKLAQSYMGYMFVIPGAASAFRTAAFREHIGFDHDTITEDLDFTYKLHHRYLKIAYDRRAISYTQDPTTLHAYINQMRRWYGGGWQNLRKHYHIVAHPVRALEISLIYIEGVVFALLLWIVPILNIWLGMWMLIGYGLVAGLFGVWASFKAKRVGLVLAPLPYLFLLYVNSFVFLEQFVSEFLLQRKHLLWFKPERKSMEYV